MSGRRGRFPARGRTSETAAASDGFAAGEEPPVEVAREPVPPTAEHGRGLQIIDAVADNVRLTQTNGEGTTVHFEKELDWVPDAPGRHLFSAS